MFLLVYNESEIVCVCVIFQYSARKTNFSLLFLKRKKQKHLKFNLYQKAFFIYFF